MENGWVVNFIENTDGTKTVEIGTENFFPVQLHFGHDKDFQTRFVEVFDTLNNSDVPFIFTEWDQ